LPDKPEPLPLEALVGRPSGNVTTADFRVTGLPGTDEGPKPVPDGVLKQYDRAALTFDRARNRFVWAVAGGEKAAASFWIGADKDGVSLSGVLPHSDAAETDEVVRLLRVARQVYVWMLHGELPGYVLEFLDSAEALGE